MEITEGKVRGGENGGYEKGRRGAQGAGLESTEGKGGGLVESTDGEDTSLGTLGSLEGWIARRGG